MAKKESGAGGGSLEIEWVDIDEIIPYASNPRKNDEAVDKVAASISEFGWQQPIVVDKENVVIVGHTRLKAAKKLGLEKVPVTVARNLTEAQAKQYRLVDNKTNEFAEWDFEMLENELADIDFDFDFGFDMDGAGEGEGGEGGAGEKKNSDGILREKFLIPPFSVLDSRQGYWRNRERAWAELIQDGGETRADVLKFSNTIKELNPNFSNASIFDPVLAELILRWFLPYTKDALVIDPFAGDTSVGYISSVLGARFKGVEIRQEQCDANMRKVRSAGLSAEYICDDGQNIAEHIEAESADLLFSCPPYFDLEVYSDLENDASNQGSYEEFYKILDNAFTAAIKCLKPNRFAVIVVGDVRNKKDGSYYNFPNSVRETFMREGLHFYNEMILVDPVASAAVRAAGYMKSRKVAHVHQNVLVFYKGDPNKIKDIYPELDFSDLDDMTEA